MRTVPDYQLLQKAGAGRTVQLHLFFSMHDAVGLLGYACTRPTHSFGHKREFIGRLHFPSRDVKCSLRIQGTEEHVEILLIAVCAADEVHHRADDHNRNYYGFHTTRLRKNGGT
ncbi:hypothetical protein [Stenotrophomonas sp. AG209]|uniref:hypothetical protein n=1 Tax=Stenotrophomonas sp. AG209 TaxID=2183909 RepID=UPI0011C42EE7|nr:hypothetical protein [Stenotrophomonas sp. AG209]